MKQWLLYACVTMLIVGGIIFLMKSRKSNLLEEYSKKRDFSISPEPADSQKRKKSDKPIFVIQKHFASHLHFDVRLEIDGVLVSWAVPKGPSLNPEEKRLAVHTENHPLAYAEFEGVIPKGQYGAGVVMIWDHGTFKNIGEEKEQKISLAQSLKEGKIEVFFQGKRVKGGFAFIRFKDEKNQWLLIKMKDKYADKNIDLVKKEVTSIVTDRTKEEIEQDS